MRITVSIILLMLFYSGVVAQWQQTSGPEGGYTSHLIKILDHLFVNGQSGGIFRSDDNGLTWTAKNNGLPSYPHCYFLIRYGNKLYASIYSKGIYLSDDLGENWSSIGLGTEGITTYALAVNDQDIFAGYSEGGFYYSPDHGETWSLHEGVLKTVQVRDFVLSGNKVFAAVNGGTGKTGVYASEDKGITWTKLSLAVSNINAMAGYDNALYVSDGSLKISRDHGVTWTSVALGTGNYFMKAISAVGDDVYVGASDKAVFYSHDEGQTWTSKLITSPDNDHNSILSEGNKIWLATLNGVFYSEDGGNSFSAINSGLRNEIIDDLMIDGDTLMALSITGLSNSWDNGDTWSQTTIGNRNRGRNFVNGIHVGDGYKVAGTFEGIFKTYSVHGGWTRITLPQGYESISTLTGDEERVVAGVYNQGVYTSDNGGEGWVFKPASAFGDRGLTFSKLKGDTIIIGGPENILISTDFGETWATSRLLSGFFFPRAVAFDGSSWILIAAQGIFKSLDKGASWLRIDDLAPHLNPEGIVISKEGNYYVGTQEGVYVSFNRGVYWYPLNTGLKKAVTSLVIRNDQLFCGTYGMGVWMAAINRLNVKPKITQQKTEFTITTNESIVLSLEDFNVTDPDNESLTLIIGEGSNYTVTSSVITPVARFVGDLTVPVQVYDGVHVSDVFNATVRVLNVVSTSEFVENLKIYPNPVSDMISVEHPNRSAFRILLLDHFGKVLQDKNTSGGDGLSLDISDVSAGLYLLKVQSAGETKIVRISKK